MSEGRTSDLRNSYPYSWSDLTVKEFWTLAKAFFSFSIVCGLIFGIPSLLLATLFEGAENLSLSPGLPTLSQMFEWALFGYIFYLIFKDPPYTLKYLGEMFSDLAALAGKLSRIKQVAFLAFVAGFMYSASHYPDLWFWFTVLVFLPGGLTYERYKALICKKMTGRIRGISE